MNAIINDKDFWELEAEKYWAPTKNANIKELVNNAIYSGNYFAARKVDGHWYMIIKDDNGNISMRGRSKNVAGEYADKIAWVPHLKEAFSHLPCGTAAVGEIYFNGDEGSKKVTTIMGCLTEKAIARQEKGNKLSFYVFDVLAYNGEILLKNRMDARVRYINVLSRTCNNNYIVPAEYYEGEVLSDYIAWVRENGYEGVVLQRKDGFYEEGKRPTRKSIKIKKELDNEVDCFLTGVYKPSTFDYTGKEIENWTYWFNQKTNIFSNMNHYDDYLDDATWIPITKGAFHGWAGSIELGVYDGDKIVPIAWISNITEEIKRGIVEEKEKWTLKVVTINAMERDDASGCFRHAKIMMWRDDKPAKDCLLSDIK